MKHMKKLAGLLLALVMALSLATTAFADTETGTITINNAVVGQTYTVYQILDLESYDSTANAYAYKATTAWSNFINSDAIKGVYVNVDDQGYVTWVNNASAADFAKAAQKYAADNKLDNQGTQVAAAAEGSSDTTTTVTFTGLDLGYYLVDSTLGTLCSLDTTNPSVTIQEKNKEVTNVKEVEEDSTGNYGEENDADIGQTVNFQSTITAQAGAQNYVFHDKMDKGLTFGGSVTVTLNNATVDSSNYTFTDYTATGATTPTDGCTFEVAFTKAFCDTLKANDKIVISYNATVNENAVVGGNGNKNESKVSYGENGDLETTPSETITRTWDVDVFKYTEKGGNKVALSGATFTLSKDDKGANPIALIREKDDQGNNTNTYRVAKTGETGTVTEITTDGTGTFTIKGLDSDTYYLTETAAPAGYNKLADPIKIVISNTGAVTTGDSTTIVNQVEVLNQSGTELPSTGGMGTTIFYVVGSILLIGAAVLLITKKRMDAEK